MAANDEAEAIHNRALVEERYVKRISRRFCMLAGKDTSLEDSEKQFTSLVLDAHIQQACMEHLPRHVEHAIQECSAVDATIKSFEEELERSRKTIGELHAKLVDVKQERANQEQYTALAGVIKKHPPRSATSKQLETVEQEIKALHEIMTETEEATQAEAKEFSLLMRSVNQLKRKREVAFPQAAASSSSSQSLSSSVSSSSSSKRKSKSSKRRKTSEKSS